VANKHGYKKDFYQEFYKTHHGLHVIDEVFIDGCPACAERAKIIVLARARGEDPNVLMATFGEYDQTGSWSSDFLSSPKKRIP
jgi:hypothetical protein